MIKQAIIPLAGLGTRLLPLTSVFAKELLPINGRPGIEYILDECIEAGVKEIIFIILIFFKPEYLKICISSLLNNLRKKNWVAIKKIKGNISNITDGELINDR